MQKLLTNPDGNTKTEKSQALGIDTYIQHLAPARMAILPGDKLTSLCPHASAGCESACLVFSGRAGIFAAINEARIRRTRFYVTQRADYLRQLVKEIESAIRSSARRGKTAVFRLNGTSDVVWERSHPVIRNGIGFPSLMAAFPDVQFYDYTKILGRLRAGWKLPANYHLTASRSETNDAAIRALPLTANIAVPFNVKRGESLPATWAGRPVIDADKHDLRYLDPVGSIAGLRVKGSRGKADSSGFIVEVAA